MNLSNSRLKKEDINKVYENENLINILEKEITEYLVELSQHNLPEENAKLLSEAYHSINDIERIGDHCENIVELASARVKKNIEITDDALEELEEIYKATLDALEIAISSYENESTEHNSIIDKVEDRIDSLEKKFRSNNIKRLNSKRCMADAGVMLFDLLSNLERIGDHANNIATAKEVHNNRLHA